MGARCRAGEDTGRSVLLAWALACTACAVAPSAGEPTQERTGEIEPEPATVLSLTPLADGLWLHTSTRELDGYGPFPSHGLVVDGPEGPLLIDTAWGAAASEELHARVEAELGQAPVASIVTDFHDDRAGGLGTLQDAGVAVWSSAGIAARLDAASLPAPARTLDMPIFRGAIAGVELEVWFPGAGHSPENLVVWLPEQGVLFGGCLLRGWDSRSLGNLEDADVEAWRATIDAVRRRYGHARVVVPSHAAPGGPELLAHTAALVEIERTARAEQPPTRMAITVDDLPVHGPLPEGTTRADVHARFVEVFADHGVPKVRGFVVGEGALASEDHRAALELWLAAGHPLGNHTWSHPNMEAIGVDAYLADIERNEAVLAELSGDADGRSWRVFRYPYLRQGFDAASSARVREHLAARGYRIAEVSVDFWDWDYQAPYVRCLEAGAGQGVEALRSTYLARATEMLDWHRAAALDAFGRPIAHVLLLHAGVFTAQMLDELLDAYEARGVTWVGLDEALDDPVYRDVPLPERTHGDVLVEQAITSLGVEHPPWTRHPGALLGALCR